MELHGTLNIGTIIQMVVRIYVHIAKNTYIFMYMETGVHNCSPCEKLLKLKQWKLHTAKPHFIGVQATQSCL